MSDVLQLFPPGSRPDADGTALIGDCRADDLAAEHGTPVLVVAESALRARARDYREQLQRRWPNSRVVFASKAFPCTAVQAVMVQEGLGLDVAGGGEILTGLKAGVDPGLIVLHGNAKSTEELTIAVDNGVGLVVVDGPDDVDRLEAIVPPGRSQQVLVRIIPGVTADTHAHVLTGHEGSKFGLDPAAAAELIRRIEASPRLTMMGVHAHVGSQILQAEPLAAAVAPLRALGGSRSTTSAAGWAPATPGATGPRRSATIWTCSSRRPGNTCRRRRRSSSSRVGAWWPNRP